jgi:hypothetical protein
MRKAFIVICCISISVIGQGFDLAVRFDTKHVRKALTYSELNTVLAPNVGGEVLLENAVLISDGKNLNNSIINSGSSVDLDLNLTLRDLTGTRKPSDILDALNHGITFSLNRQKVESAVKNKMDTPLCSLDYKTNKLQFSGAFNPAYLIRDGEIIQHKDDKFPVVHFLGKELKTLKNNGIQLQKGSALHTISDVYTDQFSGPKEKKFMYKQFRELLLSLRDKEIAVQKVILDENNESWRGQIEQLDDILDYWRKN